MFRRLVGCRCKLCVAESAATAFYPDDLLSVLQDFGLFFTGFFVAGNGAQGNLYNNVFTAAARGIIATAAFALFGETVFIITEME